jgi:hypothetical protein
MTTRQSDRQFVVTESVDSWFEIFATKYQLYQFFLNFFRISYGEFIWLRRYKQLVLVTCVQW